jgi:hypothetical protein
MMKFELYFERPQQPQVLMNYEKHPDIFYKELINNNCKCDATTQKSKSKEIDDYLLKSVEYRLKNINLNQNVNKTYNISNQKKADMNIILNIYKTYLIDNEIDSQNIKLTIVKKTEDINKRIKNNYTKLFKLFDDYRYYKNHISSEMKEKGKSRKLNKVNEKMHNYFMSEIELTEKRIEFLSDKLSILKFHDKNYADNENYIKRYVTDFIDKNLDINDDIGNIFNNILLYNYGNDGKYYDGIKIIKKCTDKCQNTKIICEKAMMYN